MILTLLAAGFSWFFLSNLLGVSGFLASLAVMLITIGSLRYLNILKASMIWPFNKQTNLYLAIGGLLILLFTAPAMFGNLQSELGLTTAEVTTVETTSQVAAAGCVVSEELKGKQATVDIDYFDVESDTESEVTGNITVFDQDGNKVADQISTDSDLTVAAGSVLDVAGNTTTYYIDPISGICVDSLKKNVRGNAHTIAGDGDMQVVGYDDTASTTLNTDTYSDYYIDMSADEETTVYFKLKTNTADKAMNFAGWAVAEFNDIDSVTAMDSDGISFSKVFTPDYLENVDIKVNETGSTTITEDYTVFKANSNVLLHEYDELKVKFKVTADSSAPSDADGTADVDGFAVMAFDSAGAKGSDGEIYYDFYQHDENEGNVGMFEAVDSPQGLTTGAMVTLI